MPKRNTRRGHDAYAAVVLIASTITVVVAGRWL
jgi:hypothetical protein